MELRRAADALLRSNASPLSTLLVPSSNIRWATQRQLISRHTSASPLRRTLITSSRKNAIRPEATTSAPSTIPEIESSSETTPKAEEPKKDITDDTFARLSSSLWAKPSRATSASPFESGSMAKSTSPSASTLLRGLSQPRPGEFDIGRMMDVPGSKPTADGPAIDAELMNAVNMDIMPMPGLNKVPLRLNPSMGRHQLVSERVDVGRAFQLVEMSCAKNKVRRDVQKQRFHERPGLKRKRLRRERWRTRFQEGFKATVNRVKQLKQQGW